MHRPVGPRQGRRLPTDRPPTHPGEVLVEEFLEPLGLTQVAFVERLGVSFPRPMSMALGFSDRVSTLAVSRDRCSTLASA